MKISFIILILFSICIDTSFADSLPKIELSTPTLLSFSSGEKEDKAPNIFATTALAVFPGIIFHGLGHFYIGDYFTASILLSVEAISWPFIIMGFGCSDSNAMCVINELGGLMFITSWLYDVIAAPIKASKMRKEYEKKKKEKQLAPEIGFIPANDFKGGSLVATWRF